MNQRSLMRTVILFLLSAFIPAIISLSLFALSAWVDVDGHIWVSNSHFTWDVSHGSSFIVKIGNGPDEWRYYQDVYNYYFLMGKSSGDPYAYATQQNIFTSGTIVNNPDGSITVVFDDALERVGVEHPFLHSFTFYENSGLIKVQYYVDNVAFNPDAPPALTCKLSLTPGGDKQNDFYYYPGAGTARAFPYGSWTSVGKAGVSSIDGWVYVTDYDTAARQGLAFIGRLAETADHITDINYGIIHVVDTTHYGNYSHIALSMNATSSATFYMFVYETGAVTPYSPVEDLIALLPVPNPPESPSCLSTTAVSSTQINLVWTDNSDDETGFKIERKVASGSYSQIGTVGADVTSYPNTELIAGTYCYRVLAYNAAGDSSYSNENCSATTTATVFERMYVTDFGAHKVVTADINCSNTSSFPVSGCESYGPLSIAIDSVNQKLYVSNWTEDKIIKADLNGDNAETLTVDGHLDGPNHIALDIAEGEMYITNENTDSVTVATLDGFYLTELFLGGTLNEPYGIALDLPEGKMYVQNYSGSIVNVVRANLDGSSPEVMDLDGKLSNSRDIALDLVARRMYVVNTGTNSVTKANLDGTCANVLSLGGLLSLPYGIALDVPAGKMYVVNYGSDNVIVSNLDGSGAQICLPAGTLSASNDIELGPAVATDSSRPTPDPMTWDVNPHATGSNSVSMTATTATDPSGVEYSFEETTEKPGGTDSGWQDDPVYVDDGLLSGTEYCYIVTARDKSPNHNTTTASLSGCAKTQVSPPSADFTYVPSCVMAHAVVAFTDTSTDDGSIVEWAWDFGDGSISTDQNPTHVYAALGKYAVALTVTDNTGESNTAAEEISVYLCGDLDGDDDLDLIDVLMLYRYVYGVLDLDPSQQARADIDQDGDVDEDDAQALVDIAF